MDCWNLCCQSSGQDHDLYLCEHDIDRNNENSGGINTDCLPNASFVSPQVQQSPRASSTLGTCPHSLTLQGDPHKRLRRHPKPGCHFLMTGNTFHCPILFHAHPCSLITPSQQPAYIFQIRRCRRGFHLESHQSCD